MKIAIRKPLFILTLISSIHVVVLSLLKFFPYPEFFIYSYLTKAGLQPYSQIIDQHFPGLVFFPINFASIGIDSVSEYRIVSYVLIVLSHIAIYRISKIIIKNPKLLFLPNLLFLTWQPFLEGYVLWIDSFAQSTLLYCFYFLLNTSQRSRFLSGLMMGVTLLLKQTVAPLIFIVGVYLYATKTRKNLLPALLGFGVCLAVLLIWIGWKGIWSDFYYWSFLFNVTTFSEMGRKQPHLPELIKILPVFLSPLIVAMLYFTKQKLDRFIVLLLVFFAGSLAFAFARFDYVHLQPALPFAILSMVYTASILIRKYPILLKAIYFYLLLSILLNVYLIRPFLGKNTYFFGDFESELTLKANKYRQGGKVFAFGTTPHIYYLTNTLPPGEVFVFQFPWFMRIVEDKILTGLIQDPPRVVIRDKTSQVQGMNLVENMPKINSYVEKYYNSVEVFDNIELMVKYSL